MSRYCTLDVTYSFALYPAFDSKIQAIVGQPFVESGSDFAFRTITFRFATLAARSKVWAKLAGSDIASQLEIAKGMPGVD